ncbi:MAG: Nif3-like dinuclear metal center hexameric protein [Deltaproteobacteria bacterium]|nr:Nif3-like dinuclear metal center hexameric protein [Deltaproteobacteria bacterium]
MADRRWALCAGPLKAMPEGELGRRSSRAPLRWTTARIVRAMTTSLHEITRFLDEHLRVRDIPDEPNALNGLQVEATQEVGRIACAVDATESSIEEACRLRADLLLVHHGLFWSGHRPIVGPHARKIGRCFGSGLSVYSAHLPLDVHPEHGNNAGLVKALGLTADGTFGRYQDLDIGLTAACDWTSAQLLEKVRAAVGPCKLAGRGPDRIRRVGVVSGGGGSFASGAARAGLDALLTGEGAHHTALEAEERGVHLLLAGHYRTETFGVKALGELLAGRFGLPWSFVEHDTGL